MVKGGVVQHITGIPDEETYQRVKLYLIHQFTTLGAPQIWNGDEMGMTGGDDPDCRKPLWWPEFEFEPEYRNNLQTGKKIYDEVGFSKEHFDFYTWVVQLRKQNPVLVDGSFEFLVAEGKKLSYKRKSDTDEIIVMFNLEDNVKEFELPKNEAFINLMDDMPAMGKVMLPSLGAGIFKKIMD